MKKTKKQVKILYLVKETIALLTGGSQPRTLLTMEPSPGSTVEACMQTTVNTVGQA